MTAEKEIIEKLENKVVRLEKDLENKMYQIQQMENSSSWKLTRVLRFSGRILRNPKNFIIDLKDLIIRKSFNPILVPVAGLEQNDEKWIATSEDPQFELIGDYPLGFSKVIVHIKGEGHVTGNTRLYLNSGKGYSEEDSYDLGETGQKRELYVDFNLEKKSIRLDPIDRKNNFEIIDFNIIRVSILEKKIVRYAKKIRKLYSFISFSAKKGRSWYKKRGRLPKIHEFPVLLRKALHKWNSSVEISSTNIPKGLTIPPQMDTYDAWLEVNQWNGLREKLLNDKILGIRNKQILSIIMPVYNPPIEFLIKAIESVIDQIYPYWQLCIADDSSTDPEVRKVLDKYALLDSRIVINYREKNGNISLATNSAVELAKGEFLVLMDNDDELTKDALAEIAIYLDEHPETDVLYSDDDKIDNEGNRFDPQFKPDWSPELLLSYMYLSHIFVLRAEMYSQVGGMQVGYEGSQDYDLALRVTEKARHIGHIPKILYHWRVLPGSTASSGHAKPSSFEAGRKAIQDAFSRRGIEGEVYQPDWAYKAGCGIYSHKFPESGPEVSIIIPTKNNKNILKKCIDSIVTLTTYKNYKIVVIDNESDDENTLLYLKTLPHKVLKINNIEGKFNYARIHNLAVEEVDSQYILFLNNDTEVISPEWLSQMIGYMGIEGVGIVGAKLIYPDNRIQHAGVIHGLYKGMVGPAFKLAPHWDNGYLSYTAVSRNYLAVTAACLLTTKDLFLEVGGFNSDLFAVAYNDVDYCYKVHDKGKRIVYCPTAELYHYEGLTRGFVDNPAEPAAFRELYGSIIDPYYNRNLSLENERFEINSRLINDFNNVSLMNVLICTFTLDWTGGALHQYEIAIDLKKKGVFNPIVYCPSEGPLRKLYEENGVQVFVFKHPLSEVNGISSYNKAIDEFSIHLEEWNIDVVYGNTYQSFFSIDAAKRADIPSIWNIHESEPWQTYFNYFGDDIATQALNCMQYPYKVIFVSDATREQCEELNSHRSFTTIYNGINITSIKEKLDDWTKEKARSKLDVQENEVAYLLLGTVCERKGQIDLINAVKEIPSEAMHNLKFFIVGDRESEYSNELWKIYNELSNEYKERIQIIKETPQISLYFSAADVFLCTSRVESFPRVTLEAMACELPIITTPVYGLKEQIQNGVNGVFYNPGDYASLASLILTLANDKDKRTKMANNSKYVLKLINDFDTMVNAYGELFIEAGLCARSRQDLIQFVTH